MGRRTWSAGNRQLCSDSGLDAGAWVGRHRNRAIVDFVGALSSLGWLP